MLTQEHSTDQSCPCEYSDEQEYCLVKHLIHIQSLAEETIAMTEDAKLKDTLSGIAGAANDLRRAYEESPEDKRPYADIAQFARDARKAIEPYLFRYKQPAALKQKPKLVGHPGPGNTWIEHTTGELDQSLLAKHQEWINSQLKQEEPRWCLPTADLHMPAPFGWPGGKRQLAKKIVSLIPPHKTYVEPFAGAAWVFWAKEPSEIEVLNDIDPDLMRFYQNIGDIKKCNIAQLSEDWDKLKAREGKLKPCEFLTETLCSFGYDRQTKVKTYRQSGGWRACYTDAPKFHQYLPKYQERLKRVKLYNDDWQKVVQRYDAPDTFFYLDPPYHSTSRRYRYSDDQLARLAETLPRLKGKWLLSYDDHPEVRQAFKQFHVLPVASNYTISGGWGSKGEQLLIANYPLQSAQLKQEEKMKTELKADPLLTEIASQLCTGGICFARGNEMEIPPLVKRGVFELKTYGKVSDWYFASEEERKAVDKWLAKIKHPLVFEPGTMEQRYIAIVKEMAERRNPGENKENVLPICSPSEAEALERCIAKVKAKQPKHCEKEWHKPPEEMREGCYNPYSVCRASVGCRLGGTEEYERKIS
jgi:DNA adenine methylase